MTIQSPNTAKLTLQDIGYTYRSSDTPMFTGLNLSVTQGQVLSIVGASGVGKTTLFNIAAGLIVPQQGAVYVDGKLVTGQAGHVGYMLQKDLLLPFKTMFDNIALPLVLQGVSKERIQALVKPKLEHFGLNGLQNKYSHQLSGGQKQRAALLRTYLSNDALMLLDEPFSALDYVTKSAMYDWFRAFRRDLGLTCLMITHDIDEAIYLSDCIYVLKGAPATLAHCFSIPQTPDFLHSIQYLKLKQEILQAIRS